MEVAAGLCSLATVIELLRLNLLFLKMLNNLKGIPINQKEKSACCIKLGKLKLRKLTKKIINKCFFEK